MEQRFKTGDTVRRIRIDHFSGHLDIGDIGVIGSYFSTTSYRLKGIPSQFIFLDSYFELVEAAHVVQENHFEVGDVVQYTDISYRGVIQGRCYNVSEVCPATGVLFLKGLVRYGYAPESFEKIEPPFKIGDTVRRISNDSEFFRVGETGVVTEILPRYSDRHLRITIEGKEQFVFFSEYFELVEDVPQVPVEAHVVQDPARISLGDIVRLKNGTREIEITRVDVPLCDGRYVDGRKYVRRRLMSDFVLIRRAADDTQVRKGAPPVPTEPLTVAPDIAPADGTVLDVKTAPRAIPMPPTTTAPVLAPTPPPHVPEIWEKYLNAACFENPDDFADVALIILLNDARKAAEARDFCKAYLAWDEAGRPPKPLKQVMPIIEAAEDEDLEDTI